MNIIELIAWINALFWTYLFLVWLRWIKKLTVLADFQDLYKIKEYPFLSVVIAARNEEKSITRTIESLLQQNYPRFEIIVMNDRSQDRTMDLVNELAQRHKCLRVFDIKNLPAGWIGKNYALYYGAMRAKGEWILFTDADVHFNPDTLKKAIAYATLHNLDHLTAAPEVTANGFFLKIFVNSFSSAFGIFTRPWSVKNARSKTHTGIGAFNLLRARTYLNIGTHKTIALRPDDDLKLGKLVKKYGFRQELVFGNGLIHLEWYPNLNEAIRGLHKNIFAGANYRFISILWIVLILFLTSIFPFAAVFIVKGISRFLFGYTLLIMFLLQLGQIKYLKVPLSTTFYYFLFYPIGTGILIYAILQSTFKTLFQKGIVWRGTYYPLNLLKKNKV